MSTGKNPLRQIHPSKRLVLSAKATVPKSEVTHM